ncbi:selenide, water dikinase SelD [Maritimibacter sp. DP1N21-5]|uniref:selenide, water dikinase SelD n=1 Tax=Maritimibacter sp. DP1N21-5 TaxID=2836867 RepID=UPI001C44D9DE|nr:selenide, water dikinase SelD [Maritimibacter sp. DP1N21-5]MBV7410591.1 selenide, water dikinase SelD [Maritimibacter sp. DP1N21-5]
MQSQIPLTRDVVLIGGGHAHALVLRMWGMNPLPGVRLTVVHPGPTAPYSGMLPGHVAGHYAREELDLDLVRLCRFAGARLVTGWAEGVDPVARRVRLAGGREIAYDVASLDVGVHAGMSDIDGFDDHALGVKPLDRFAGAFREFRAQVRAGDAAPEVAVIGAGVAGCEVALAMDHALRQDGATPRVALIEATGALTGFAPRAAGLMRGTLERAGVQLLFGRRVERVLPDHIVLDDGTTLPSRFTLGAAGAMAHGWLAASGLPVTEAGFVTTDATCRVTGQEDLFAVGDCAHFAPDPLPKAGVYAVRVAPVLLHNLRARLSGGSLRDFRPQKDFLKLISLGGKSAIAQRGRFAVAGPLLWRWKDRIDQRFMDKFRHLPQMKQDPLPSVLADGVREELGGAEQMLCAGCGSKVGPGVLSATLSRLPRAGRDDILTGPGDDAAVVELGGVRQVLTTDHLRAFTEDYGLFARIAAHHALGDVLAMGARPQAVLAQVTLPRQSEALQARAMEEIMAAAAEVFAAEGAEIAGGHTTMGAECTVGFTVTGLVDKPITVAGAQPDDVLVLTRPIGSGTILAAEMKGAAQGVDVAAMLAVMATGQGAVARVLEPAHAMTDVTGFGLAGHLSAICRASGVGAEIVLADVPSYEGALPLAEAGYRSTIFPANKVAAPVEGAVGARADLLWDPQTAGGFLACVSVEDLKDVLAGIAGAGGQGHVIGRMVEGSGIRLA